MPEIFLNLIKGMSYNEELFYTCLTGININHIQNNTKYFVKEIKKVRQHPIVKISGLDRLENQKLTVEYKFMGRMKKTKEVYVPLSQFLVQQKEEEDERRLAEERKKLEEEKKFNEYLIIGSSAGGGVVLVLLIVLTVVCMKKRKAKAAKTTNYNTDENHTYGTYATDDDGEYEYDVAEVVDNNELYGGVGGAETHDNNDYYET